MIKVLFLIHDLGHGGAEKVLVNLVNNMDPAKFDISVTALFGGGVNEQFLKPHIHFQTVFPRMIPGNSHVMKLFTPRQLYRLCVKEHYDIAVSYLEGPSARIISGCPHKDTKLVSWIHCTMHSPRQVSGSFRSIAEATRCYNRLDTMVFVAETAKSAFLHNCAYAGRTAVLYNTNDTAHILRQAAEPVVLSPNTFRWCGMGKLTAVKGFDRMLRIQKRLADSGHAAHLYLLGEGELRSQLENTAKELGIADSVSFLGYQTNPYKFVKNCDLFVCSSHSEGFSTAATEALIVGTPVVTTLVSGMKEMLGEGNEWGIVTENDEESLYQGIKCLLDDPALLAHYKEKAAARGKTFSTANTVSAVEDMLLRL